jgi:hypothetical protein
MVTAYTVALMAVIVTTLAYVPLGALVAILAFGAFDVPLHSLLTFGGLRGSLCEDLISLLLCSFPSEANMPKGQQRSNREKKKPKQPKKPLPPTLPGRRPG